MFIKLIMSPAFILCQLHSMIFNEPLSTTLTICANKIYVFKEVKNSLLGKFFTGTVSAVKFIPQ